MSTAEPLFQHMLVPLNFTDANERALKAVRQLAGSTTRTTLLHVIEVVNNIPFEELKDFYVSIEKKARRELDGIAERLKAEGLNVETEITFGRRDREILRCASELDVDLIVLSSRPFDPERSAESWGTISHKVGLVSRCPVLLMR